MNNTTHIKCDICYDSDYDKLIYESKLTLTKLSNELVNFLTKGYSCDKNSEFKISYLTKLLNVLEIENRKINLGALPCLTNFNKQSIAEKVRKLTTLCNIDTRKDLIIDNTNEQQWISNNPYCVSREKWEKFAFQVCGVFNLQVDITSDSKNCDININPKILSIEDACNLTFEISRNIIPCDVVIAISIYEELCNLDLKVSRTEDECEIDFEILVSENKCDIELELYKKFIQCNLSFDIIKTAYENGCSFEVGIDDEIVLISALNKYPLNKLNFKGHIRPEDIRKLGISNKSEYLKNPKSFIEKLKSDYGK